MECESPFPSPVFFGINAKVKLRFLLARLHMDSLINQPTIGHLTRALGNLPRGPSGLYKTYDQAVHRMKAQEETCQDLARQIITWIFYARRPLLV